VNLAVPGILFNDGLTFAPCFGPLNVYYTASDEAFYVGAGPGRYQETYRAESVAEAIALVEADGWQAIGSLGRFDNEAVRAWGRGSSLVTSYYAELIAIWDDLLQPVKQS
jgi:hypothetical protein